jgi:class 3 adenylate cyclase
VTVMFSDLVGSTALSARMDPEDLREVISAYQKRVAETVGRFGGFVAKFMGDGVLIYLATPRRTRTTQSEPSARAYFHHVGRCNGRLNEKRRGRGEVSACSALCTPVGALIFRPMLSGSQCFTEKGRPKSPVSTLITARHRVVTSAVFL